MNESSLLLVPAKIRIQVWQDEIFQALASGAVLAVGMMFHMKQSA